MQVVKVVAEGTTTSFRQPHFMIGIQPSHTMPPPSTIYGHCCSALGEIFPPDGVAFAYHFTHQGRFCDVEHTHIVGAAQGKIPGTSLPKVQEGNINPYKRELFFRPRLVLYLNRPEWESAFRSPHYAVVLGRTQDLFTYTSVETIELEQAPRAYFEHTLLPYHMAARTRTGTVELLQRYLDYSQRRRATSARYLLLEECVQSDAFMQVGEVAPTYWVDPTSPLKHGAHLGLMFHTFVGDTDETFVLEQ